MINVLILDSGAAQIVLTETYGGPKAKIYSQVLVQNVTKNDH